jgi:cytochrome c-type biogenesis protein CcmH
MIYCQKSRKLLRKIEGIILASCISSVSFASVENTYHFNSPLRERSFQHLISELRCLVCQNQSLAESNAPLATDLKKEIYFQINAGFTEEAIKHYLVERYGNYILFRPILNRTTLILWLGPFLFLSGAFLILSISIYQNRKISQ